MLFGVANSYSQLRFAGLVSYRW